MRSICETTGLDVIYLGAYDLSIDLGYDGDTTNPCLVEIIFECISTIQSFGKSAGLMVSTPEQLRDALHAGATFIVCGVDTSMISSAAADAVKQFRISQHKLH